MIFPVRRATLTSPDRVVPQFKRRSGDSTPMCLPQSERPRPRTESRRVHEHSSRLRPVRHVGIRCILTRIANVTKRAVSTLPVVAEAGWIPVIGGELLAPGAV